MKTLVKILFLFLFLSPPFVLPQIQIPTVNGWYYVPSTMIPDIAATKSYFSSKSNSQIFVGYGNTMNHGISTLPYWNFQTGWLKDFSKPFSVPDTVLIDCSFVVSEGKNIKAINVFVAFQSNEKYYFIGKIDENKNIPLDGKWKTLSWGELKRVKEFGLLSFIRFYLHFQIVTQDSCYTGASVEVRNLRGVYGGGETTIFDRFSDITSVPEEKIPDGFALYQNYPNPFNPTTKIQYSIPIESGPISLKVYDITGREVVTLVDHEQKPAGIYEVNFDASNLSSGVYMYKLQSSSHNVNVSKKMMLIK